MTLLRILIGDGVIGRARSAVNLAFFILGVTAGLWAVFIPVVRGRLEISEGILGLVLLVIALGSMAAMPATGWAIARYGSRAISASAAVAMPVAAALPLLSPSLTLLFIAAFAFGAASGVLDVSMNNEAARVERARDRPSMSAFHALYSVGGLAGAGAGALLVGLGPTSAWAASAFLLALGVAAALVHGWYLAPTHTPSAGFRFIWPSGVLLGLGALAFLTFGLEGAVADWSALFLISERAASPTVAAAGYAAFAGAMAVMRFVGDRLVARYGRMATLQVGGLIIAAGGALAILAPWPLVSATGFGLIGIGAANVVPVLLSSAARYPESGGVAAVSSIGYLGMLSWPPAIGSIAEASGLPMALSLIVIAGIVIAAGFGLVRARTDR